MTAVDTQPKELKDDLHRQLLEQIEAVERDVKAVRASLEEAIRPLCGRNVNKIVVAIHGIGDQYHNATVQSVVTIFARCFNRAAAVPLGGFYSADGTVEVFQLGQPPQLDHSLASIGFVEAYWADIPRRVQHQGYIIEETKAWARTIVERVRATYGNDLESEGLLKDRDYLSAASVIEDMIDAIAVIGNLVFLAEKAGLFKFDLDSLLTAYVGDVQIVADFANYRARIVRQFHRILDAVHTTNPDADIYVVAHSEGTVVAFLGLLRALSLQVDGNSDPVKDHPRWVEHVKGLMTIGSPIDKHIILWPDIWTDVENPNPRLKKILAKNPIKWRNYYDYGDPVGFKLDTARSWLKNRMPNFFEFRGDEYSPKERDDFGFTRYFLPGKAHNDYWNDPYVFGHFMCDVMGLEFTVNGDRFPPVDAKPGRPVSRPPPPPDRPLATISSYVTPFFLIAVVIYAAVYIVLTACNSYVGAREEWQLVLRDVASIGSLLAAVTIASRIQCLSRSWGWWTVAWGAFIVGLLIYLGMRTNWLFQWLMGFADPFAARPAIVWSTSALAFIAVIVSVWADRHRAWLQRYPPARVFARGARPLLLWGCAAAAWLAMQRINISEPKDATGKGIWSLLLAGAAFIYLWWLAIVLFDLVFTWHRYIRHAVWQDYLGHLRSVRMGAEKASTKQ